MEIISLLLTKEVLQVLAPALGILFAVFYIYNKGKKSGSEQVTEKFEKAEDEIFKDVRKAEKENVKLEKEKNDQISEIKSISGQLSSLIELWNKTTRGGKAPDSKTRKK